MSGDYPFESDDDTLAEAHPHACPDEGCWLGFNRIRAEDCETCGGSGIDPAWVAEQRKDSTRRRR